MIDCIDNIFGTIRKVGNTWSIINDANHSSYGLKSVKEVSNNRIEVTFDKAYPRVGTASVQADETYAANGYVFGASCGLDKVTISYSNFKNGGANNSNLGIKWSNIWIDVKMWNH